MDSSYPEIEKNFNKEAAKLFFASAQQAIALIENNIAQYHIDCGYFKKRMAIYFRRRKQTDELEKILEASKNAGCNYGMERRRYQSC